MKNLVTLLRGRPAAQPYGLEDMLGDLKEAINPNRTIKPAERKARAELNILHDKASIFLAKKIIANEVDEKMIAHVEERLKLCAVLIDMGAIEVAQMIELKIFKLISPPKTEKPETAKVTDPGTSINESLALTKPKVRRHRRTDFSPVGDKPMPLTGDES